MYICVCVCVCVKMKEMLPASPRERDLSIHHIDHEAPESIGRDHPPILCPRARTLHTAPMESSIYPPDNNPIEARQSLTSLHLTVLGQAGS